jgi:hypothetical protein
MQLTLVDADTVKLGPAVSDLPIDLNDPDEINAVEAHCVYLSRI